MDYHSIHGQDVSNFTSDLPRTYPIDLHLKLSSIKTDLRTDRLPAVSAAQALEELNSPSKRCISTGLPSLDSALQGRDVPSSEGDKAKDVSVSGGVSKGKVTDVFGPPGVGKTAFGLVISFFPSMSLAQVEGLGSLMVVVMQDAVSYERVACCEAHIGLDGAHPLSSPRFSDILGSSQSTMPSIPTSTLSHPSGTHSLLDLLDNFTHITTPTLAHLVALLCHPIPSLFPAGTSLVVIDSFSALIDNAFPKNIDSSNTPRRPGAPNPAARKFPVLQYLITSFHKLAATYNIAIVILSQCVTKMRPGGGAALVPAINTTAWEQGLACRIALFRDWGWENEVERSNKMIVQARFAEVLKAEGSTPALNARILVAFEIVKEGLKPISLPEMQPDHGHLPYSPINFTPSLPQKRKLSATGLEIPDSEGEDDEDYGWAEEDEEAVPEMPPQWQGSEDILVPAPGELEADSENNEEDDTEEHEGEPHKENFRKPSFRDVIDDSEDELAL
ncbi:hypothetical protein B7463_g535, partial [Scytalidium lignicola]